jgi:hypothetical protein
LIAARISFDRDILFLYVKPGLFVKIHRTMVCNGMANSRPFATVENAGFTVAPHCSFLDNTLRTIDKAVAIFVIGLLLAVGRWHLQFGGASVHHRNIDI